MDVSIYDIIAGNGYQVEGYTIDTYPVPFVDNEGEPCDTCAVEGNAVSHTVYGVMNDGPMSGLYVSMDRCHACVVPTIRELDPFADVKVEFGLIAVLVVEVNTDDLMHGPDCQCAHSDAI